MYYFLTQDLDDYEYLTFDDPSELSSKRIWVSGLPFDEPYPNDTFYVEASMGDNESMPDFFDSSVPIMSDKLLNRLMGLGIDNIEAFPVTIKRTDAPNIWHNYYAINIIGLMDIIDRDKSVIETENRFHSVVIDEKKANGVLCTRLYRGPAEMLIHESVAKPLLKEDFGCLKIVKSEDYDEDD